MAKCPKCNAEISHLVNWQGGENRYTFDGKDYEFDEFVFGDSVNDYECPECSEVLFTSEDEAREFLEKNEKTN